MNLAVIIGVSEYRDKRNNLPGCANDASVINNTISKSEKFDSILLLNSNQDSAKVKEELTNFISNNKGQQIDEFLFYYTGHGEFYSGEFYYILSDFDPLKRKQTSLQNSEVDTLIKTLSPNLVVKVIDACQSGTSYIKESDAISKYFDSSKLTFDKCYFLNSSLNTQSSFQDHDISFFTKSFVESIKQHRSDEIRYKDIIDFISDEFEGNSDQTPFFVIQADLTEKFCSISKELRQYLNNSYTSASPIATDNPKSQTLVDLVRIEAKDYSTKEDAIRLLEEIKTEATKVKPEGILSDLYDLTVSTIEDTQNIPSRLAIGKWLKDNPDTFFARPTYKPVYESTSDMLSALSRTSLLIGGPKQAETKYEMDGYELKIEVPFKGFTVLANAKFPNLSSYNLTILFLVSKKTIRFFYFIASYIEESWDNRTLNSKEIEWKSVEFKITEKAIVLEGLRSVLSELNARVSKDLSDRYKTK